MESESYCYIGNQKNDDELVPNQFFDEMTPTRKANVERFLSNLPMAEREDTNCFAHDISSETPLASVSAIIPIAAHQEHGAVRRAMACYATQRDCGDFSIILYPNIPLDVDPAKANPVMDEISGCQEEFTELDIRSTTLHVCDENIGQLRRTIWSAAILLAYTEGAFDEKEEFLGLNHDIDLENISPHYIRRIKDFREKRLSRYRNLEKGNELTLQVMGTRMRHNYDTERPNLSQVVGWTDYMYRMAGDIGPYEASLVIPLAHYAKTGGHRAVKTHETSQLTRKQEAIPIIPGTSIVTSPRRYFDRLHEHEIGDTWTEDSFGAHDTCRDGVLQGDITHDRKEHLILNDLEAGLDMFFYQDIKRRNELASMRDTFGISGQEQIEHITKKLQRKKKLAMRVLSEYVGSPKLANLVNIACRPGLETANFIDTDLLLHATISLES